MMNVVKQPSMGLELIIAYFKIGISMMGEGIEMALDIGIIETPIWQS